MIVNDFFDFIDPGALFASFSSAVGQFDGLLVWIVTTTVFYVVVNMILYMFIPEESLV